MNTLPVLRTDGPMNMAAYTNFMTPSISPVMMDTTSVWNQSFNNIPVAGGNMFGYPQAYMGDYNLLQNRALTASGNSEAGFDSLDALSGETLEKARTSKEGDFAVNSKHSQIASMAVEKVKEVLGKDSVSESEAKEVEKVFSALAKNPMIAEAFVKEANETSFKGSHGGSSNLLASYEQVLTKLHGKEQAKEKIEEIKSNLNKAVGGRNKEAMTEFKEGHESQSGSVDYTFGERLHSKASAKPFAVATLGLAGAGAAGVVGYKSLKLFGRNAEGQRSTFAGAKNIAKFGWKTAKMTAGPLAVFGALGAVGASVYALAKD